MARLFDDLIIFEMANNHQGSVEHGLAIIREMGKIVRRHRIKAAVKFQYRNLDTFIHPDFVDREDVKHIPRFLSTRLNQDEFRILLDATRDEGMLTMVTPFDEDSVDQCVEDGVDIIKVASCSATDWSLLEEVSGTRLPVIVSTGGASLTEIDKIVSFMRHKNVEFGLMHCVGRYPSPNDSLHLNFITKLKNRYPYLAIGYSGHEAPENNDVVKLATALGARMLERHVGLATETIRLNGYSMTPRQTDDWVTAAGTAKQICGSDESKHVSQEEMDSLQSLRRGVFVKRDIEAGTTLTRDDVFFAMPGQEGQCTSGEFGRYRAKFVASRDYRANEPVFEHSRPDLISRISSIVHDMRGMLYEARIEVGDRIEVELSHHYGIDQFRRVGAVIINVINRDYCKKLILVFPGQSHPAHSHKIKEETFQLLSGDLEVTADGMTTLMKPGDTMLVQPEELHSFRSRGGAVFEEVSTTHYPNDSYYEDERISAKNVVERKTSLGNPFGKEYHLERKAA